MSRAEREVRAALRSLVRGGSVGLAEALAGEPDALLAAAHAHGLVGLLHARCSEVQRRGEGLAGVSGEVLGTLRAAAMGQSARQRRDRTELGSVLGVLGAAGVPALVVKGPVLARLAYAQPWHRGYADLDVVVAPAHFEDALAALAEADIRLWDRNWSKLNAELKAELTLLTPLGSTVDLHWHLFGSRALRDGTDVSMNELFESARQVDVDGLTVRTLDPAATLAHVAAHASWSGLHRLVWLSDLAGLVERDAARGELDWSELVERCRRWGLSRPVGAALARAGAVAGAAVPREVLERLMGRGALVRFAAAGPRGGPAANVDAYDLARLVTRNLRSSERSTLGCLLADLGSACRRGGPLRRRERDLALDATSPTSARFDAGAGRDRYLAAVRAEARIEASRAVVPEFDDEAIDSLFGVRSGGERSD